MKRLLLCLFSVSCWLACTQSNEPKVTASHELTITETDPNAPPVYTLEVRKSFTDIPTNVRQFCTPSLTRNCACELRDLQLELTALNPVPVPQPNTESPVSVAEATQRYRTFAVANQGKPILTLFQQYFSRILLNKYGVLSSQNYPLIAYYTQQLIEANSNDVVTQARALTILKPHLSATLFNRLLQTATANARAFLPEYKHILAQQLEDLAHPPFDNLYPKEVRALHKAECEAEDQAIIQAIAQLEQMQRQIAHVPR